MASQVSDRLLAALRACDIIDLSKDLSVHRRDGPFQTSMEVLEAGPGAEFFVNQMVPRHFPQGVGKFSPESFPDRRFLRHEMVTLSTHAGSHVDAPGHYGGDLDAGAFIDAAPLQAFIGPGLCFDGSSAPAVEIRWAYIEELMREHGVRDVEGHLVLIRTGPDRAIGVDTVEALVDRGVRVIGTDHESLDGPYMRMLELYASSRDSKTLWPSHMLGRTKPYYQYENLCNLDRLPVKGFVVWGPPVLLGGATASWSRVLALVPRTEGSENA